MDVKQQGTVEVDDRGHVHINGIDFGPDVNASTVKFHGNGAPGFGFTMFSALLFFYSGLATILAIVAALAGSLAMAGVAGLIALATLAGAVLLWWFA